MTGYELSRQWFDWSFENPDMTNPNHTALYFFIIEHHNRMGQPDKFGLPMQMAKEAIGIKNYRTYSKTFEDLVNWGFVKVYQRSKNQYSANVVGLVKNTKATTKALSKALQKHSQKQVHGIVGINKPIIKEPITLDIDVRKKNFYDTLEPFVEKYGKVMVRAFYDFWIEPNKSGTKFKQECQKFWDLKRRLNTWDMNQKPTNGHHAPKEQTSIEIKNHI